MDAIKKRSVRGYLLLESLIGMACLQIILGLVLVQINQSHKLQDRMNKRIEGLNVAKMALQTKQKQMTLNDVTVVVEELGEATTIKVDGEEVTRFEVIP